MSHPPDALPSSRTKTAPLIALAVFVLGAAALLAQQQKTPTLSKPLQARLELAAGGVRVDEGAGPLPAVSGQPLPEHALLQTQPGARALVRLSDGTSIFLRDSTTLRLQPQGISLDDGELFLDAPPTDRKPQVHVAGSVTVSAADAGLSLRRKGDDVEAYVARGVVTVAGTGGRAEVHAGERARVTGTAAPDVKGVTFWEDWTGGMADRGAQAGGASGAGMLYGVDFGAGAGTPSRTLEISRQTIRAVIRDGLAETEVDQTFFNPGARNVEGWYWFTVPEGANVTGFALDTNGVIVEGELIERQEAAAQYGAAVATGHSPALLEWIDNRTFRARIYPVPAAGSRRVVLRYLQRLPVINGKLRFVHPMQSREPIRIGEFALSVDLGEAGASMDISTLSDARIEDGGRRVVMRRTGFKPLADFQLEARIKTSLAPFRVSRLSSGGENADYIMARYVPDLDWEQAKTPNADIVLVVDTSAAGDDSARQLRTATAEAVLRALSASDHFALMSVDVQATVLYPPAGLANAEDKEITAALEKLAEKTPGGATDLASMFDAALARVHGAEQPAVIYIGDGYATSGDLSGEQIADRLSRALSTSRARFFSVAAGGDAHLNLLGELARAGGGQLFSVDEAEQVTEKALRLTAAVKTPTVTDLEIELGAGLDEVFTSANGKVSRGEEVVLLAKTHHDIPRTVTVKGRLGGKPFQAEHSVTFTANVASSLVPKLWAVEAIRRLLGTVDDEESVRGKIVSMGMEYGLMTPYTSFIALESEQAYQQRGIPRRRGGLRGVRLSSLERVDESTALANAGVFFIGATGLGCFSAKDSSPMAVAAPAAQPMEMAKSREMNEPQQQYAGMRDERADKDQAAYAKMPAAPPAPVTTMAAPLDDGEADSLARIGGKAGGGGARADMAPKRVAKVEERQLKQEKPQPQFHARRLQSALGACSDVARRPLADRALLWNKRLKTATSPDELMERYVTALTSCEMADWRAEQRFLQLLSRYVRDESWAAITLGHLAAMTESQRYLARLIVRRAVNESLAAAAERAVLGDTINWSVVDGELQATANLTARIEKLKTYVAKSPDDPNGVLRLARLLSRAGKVEEALVQVRRLRDRGFLKPALTREMGNLLVREGNALEAQRVYSEIVEFDPTSSESRRLLGDIFLGHGWYGPAYRQYRSLTELNPRDWTAWLRLANAAAGEGRIDEALRLERKVIEAEGTPGPDDPRRWARLASAARLARLIASPPKDEGDPAKLTEGMQRRLKELQLFDAPGTLTIVTWEELGSDFAISGTTDDVVDAAQIGLLAVQSAGGADKNLKGKVRGAAPSDAVKLSRHDIHWNGKAFSVDVTQVEVPADALGTFEL